MFDDVFPTEFSRFIKLEDQFNWKNKVSRSFAYTTSKDTIYVQYGTASKYFNTYKFIDFQTSFPPLESLTRPISFISSCSAALKLQSKQGTGVYQRVYLTSLKKQDSYGRDSLNPWTGSRPARTDNNSLKLIMNLYKSPDLSGNSNPRSECIMGLELSILVNRQPVFFSTTLNFDIDIPRRT